MASTKIAAIRFKQNSHTLYQFSLDAKKIRELASVEELRLDKDDKVVGFQRPEIKTHIKEIRTYFDGNPYALLPNSVVLGFSKAPRFQAIEKDSPFGELIITEGTGALIIDGQQRTAALAGIESEDEFPISVVGFVAENPQEMAEHFIRVNSSKPLSRSTLYELMPGLAQVEFGKSLEAKRIPVLLLNRLNGDEDSPIKGYVKTPTRDMGVIKDSTMLRMLDESLRIGHLYHYGDLDDGLEKMVSVLKQYLGACMEVFKKEFATPPKNTKLLQAVGIITLGRFLKTVSNIETDPAKNTKSRFVKALKVIKPHTAWSSGEWNFGKSGKYSWDALQSTATTMDVVSSYLESIYLHATKGTPAEAVAAAVEETVELLPAG